VAPRQLDLFNQTNLATVMRDIKIAMNQAVRDSGKSREQVLDMVNALAARYGVRLNGRGGLSKDTFEKWLNAEDESRMPGIKGITFFCAVLNTTAPLAAMVGLLGGQVIEGADITMLKWAKRYHQAKDLRKQMKQLEEKL
jgi:hypothetical protein